jgi:N-acetylneuraminic acid mutarotase
MRLPRPSQVAVAILLLLSPFAALAANEPLIRVATWKLQAARMAPAVAVHGNHLYIFGGGAGGAPVYQAERVDLTTGKAELLGPKFIGRRFHNALEYGEKIYLFGGSKFSGDPTRLVIEVYDPVAGTLTEGRNMPHIRSGMSAVLVGDTALFFGGRKFVRSGVSSQTNEGSAYSFASDGWSAAPAMPTPRENAGSAVVSSYFIVAGGSSSSGKLTEVEMFVPAEWGWKRLPPLSTPTSNHAMAQLGNWLFLFGDREDPSQVLAYDLRTRKTTSVKVDFLPARNAAAVRVGDRIYVVGGESSAERGRGSERDEVQVFELNPAYRPN